MIKYPSAPKLSKVEIERRKALMDKYAEAKRRKLEGPEGPLVHIEPRPMPRPPLPFYGPGQGGNPRGFNGRPPDRNGNGGRPVGVKPKPRKPLIKTTGARPKY